MFFREEPEISAAREGVYLESKVLALAPDITKVVAVIMDAMEKLADTVAAKDGAYIFVGNRDEFDIARFDTLMLRARKDRRVVDKIHAVGLTVENTVVAVKAMAQIGSAVADIARFFAVADVQFPYGVEPVSPKERWHDESAPSFLSILQFSTNGPEPVLYRAVDITMAAIEFTTIAVVPHPERLGEYVFGTWYRAVPDCIAAAEATIEAAWTIQAHNDSHDKEAVGWAAQKVTWHLGGLLQRGLKSKHAVRCLRATARTTDIAGNMCNERGSFGPNRRDMEKLSEITGVAGCSGPAAKAAAEWSPGHYPELDALVSHAVVACRSMSVFADRLLISSTGSPGIAQGKKADRILMDLGLILDVLEPLIPLVHKRSVLEEVTEFLPEVCRVVRKAVVRFEKHSVDGDDTKRCEALLIRSACKVVEELCVVSTGTHPVKVVGPTMTAAVKILCDATFREND